MIQHPPAVDIIIVNFNGLRYIEDCLNSLLKTEYPFFSVIVVDNGSTDGSVELVKKKFPGVQLILNNKNLGFGKANALGMDAGKSDLAAFLNNDTKVDGRWLLPLVEALVKDASVAAACSKLLFMENPHVINATGGGMNYLGYGYDLGIYENNGNALNKTTDVFFPTAAACLVRKSAFCEIGGFDKRFFMYHEDVDLGWRLRLAGYRIVYVPESVVFHAFGGTSMKSGSMEFRNNLGLRHAMRSLIKNYEIGTLLRALTVFLMLGIRTTIKNKSPEFVKCLLWNLRVLPDSISERRKIQKSRKVSDKELSAFIWQHIRLPVHYPDYEVLNMKSFVSKGDKRSHVAVADSQSKNLGYGWHGADVYFGDGTTRYRWTKDEAALYIWNRHGEGTISMDVLALSGLLKRQRKIWVSINGGYKHEITVKSNDWESIHMPYNGSKGPLEIMIKAGDTWVPDNIFKNGDCRRLGIGIKRAEFEPKKHARPTLDGVSVIIPTFNRIKILLKTLESLERQSLSKKRFEVIVVDDGSTDSTESEMESLMGGTAMNIRYLRQENKKQGAARNLGIRHSKMPVLVFIGDDIITSGSFLEEHLNYHKEKNGNGNIVVIGYTKWAEDVNVTPFMRFIGEYGYQFGYSLIKGEGPLPFNFFYTSNISISRSFLNELEYVFDEDFTTYGWEDIELGYRLEKIGMELYYNRNAIAYHNHPINIPGFCMRQINVGKASRIFLKKYPELSWLLGSLHELKKFMPLAAWLPAFIKVLHLLDEVLSVPVPRVLYDVLLKANYAKGATAGWK